MRNWGLAFQETPLNTWALLSREYPFNIRHLFGRPTCCLLVFTHHYSRDFPFCVDSLYTCSYSHLDFHTRHLFTETAYQVTQVPREFDTRFLPFYTTCVIRCTCWKWTICPKSGANIYYNRWLKMLLIGQNFKQLLLILIWLNPIS